MCLIIHKPKGKRVPTNILDKAMQVNPDGLGIINVSNYTRPYKSLDYAGAHDLINIDDELIIHFRYATKGKVSLQNIHPFRIPQTCSWIFSNGTIDGFGNDEHSDIAEFAEVLGDITPNAEFDTWRKLCELTDNRFVIFDFDSNNLVRIGKWHERDGVYYSKANCFPSLPPSSPYRGSYGKRLLPSYKKELRRHTVAVYGTLKNGFGNHQLLESSYWAGDGKTVHAFPLEIDGLPYLHDASGVGHRVDVEVYEVDDATLADLDRLEGHPHFYKRRKTWITMEDWSNCEAWVYFVQTRDLPTKRSDMHQTYLGNPFKF
jgi:gamma-glutamylaminecyclotransferase